MKIGDKILFAGEVCTIIYMFRQAVKSPSGDILLEDSIGTVFLVHHLELEGD